MEFMNPFLLLHVLLPMHRLSGLKTTPEGRPAQSPSRLGNDSYFGQPAGTPAKATSKSAGTSLTARPHSGIDTWKAINQQLPNAGKLQRCPFLRLESPPSNSCYNPRLWQNLPQTSLHDLLGLLPNPPRWRRGSLSREGIIAAGPW